MNIIQLITAFGGGMLGAAIGGVPAFVFTGLTVIIAIFAGESGMPVIGTLSFGSVFEMCIRDRASFGRQLTKTEDIPARLN